MGAAVVTRVLLVEDDESGSQVVCDILIDLPGKVIPAVARNRDAAIALLDSEFFDLMILDLTIPATASSELPKPEFGFEVFGRAKEIAPGMPIYLLTGSSVEPFVEDLLKKKHEVDIWATGKIATVALQKKLKIDEFPALLTPFVEGPFRLDSVELDRHGLALSVPEERLLRVFAKRYQGTRCDIWELKGGLSGARVLRVKVFNSTGGLVHQSVAKVSSIGEIQNEQQRYNQYIARLPSAVTPRMLVALEFGAKATAAIFYGLADGHDASFFDIAGKSPELASVAVESTARGLAPWHDAAQEGLRPIREVRKLLLSDDDRAQVLLSFPIPWANEFESRDVQLKWGCTHRDFHGCNILLTHEGDPAVIDYGEIGDGPLSLDPVTLELSILFHPSSPFLEQAWPDAHAAAQWGDLELYIQNCPFPGYVRACRKWAVAMAAGRRELAAVAYSYLLRQLKYQDTNKHRSLALLEGAKRLWDST